MSTDPTMITEATAAAEETFNAESIKELMEGLDPVALLPDLNNIFENLAFVCRVAVLVGPIVLIVLGLAYLFLSPKEANYYFGYRCYYGMGSVQAWRFTQRLAGIVLGALGLILTGVMLVLSGGFAGMAVMDMVWRAVYCLIWEAVLALAAIIVINTAAALKFDSKGEFRNRKTAR